MVGGISWDIRIGRELINQMPNRKAKDRKRKKMLLNKQLNTVGRTAKQVKRKNKKKGVNDGGRKLYS